MGSTAADSGPSLRLDEAILTRFRADLEALWPEFARDERARLGIAISGGPDSTALLLLATASMRGRVFAATVDHGLRPESASEAAGVAALCAHLGVPHRILEVEVAAGNVQAEARIARYHALAEWMKREDIAALATGHHADDQAETLLLRLNRASGVAGLAGTRARGEVPGTRLSLLRPLLGWRRDELAGIVATADVAAVQDPSNLDERFDRVRMRKALADADWLDIRAIAQSAGHLADADAALDWAAAREWKECVRREDLGILYRPQAPRAIALRVIARIAIELDETEPRGSTVARLFDSLVAGRPASLGNLIARPDVGGWSFSKSPLRRNTAKRRGEAIQGGP